MKMNLKQKLRRPSGEEETANTSSVHESDLKNQVIEEECLTPAPKKSNAKRGGNETITLQTEDMVPGSPIAADASSLSVKEIIPQPKVQFAAESNSHIYASHEDESSIQECTSPPPVPAVKPVPIEIISELPKRTRTTRKPKKEESDAEEEKEILPVPRKGKKKPVEEDEPLEIKSIAVVTVEEETTRSTRQSVLNAKKVEEVKVPEKDASGEKEEDEALPKKSRRLRKPVEEKPAEEKKNAELAKHIAFVEHVVSDEENLNATRVILPAAVEQKASNDEKEVEEVIEELVEPEAAPKKKERKLRKPIEEKPVSAPILSKSLRPSRQTRVLESAATVVSSPRVKRAAAPVVHHSPLRRTSSSRRNVVEQRAKTFQSPTPSSPVRKIFTPKEVFR